MQQTGDSIAVLGDEIKALGNGRVAGYLVRFTDANTPDLENDFFTKDTDFDAEDGDRMTVYYNHGSDPVLKHRKLGRGTISFKDAGIWLEAQLDMRDEYEKAVYELVKRKKTGWSSAALPHLVEREQVGKSFWVKRWPLGKDGTITPTPAAGIDLTDIEAVKRWSEAICQFPQTLNVQQLKHLVDYAEALKALLPDTAESERSPEASAPEADPAQSAARAAVMPVKAPTTMTDVHREVRAMSEETKTPDVAVKPDRNDGQMYQDQLRETLKSFSATLKEELGSVRSEAKTAQETADEARKSADSVSAKIDQILQHVQDTPSIRKSGYFTEDGGTADLAVKSFGDWLLAVKRKDHTRLVKVYGSRLEHEDGETKDLTTTPGETGGYLVPQEYRDTILQMSAMESAILSRVQTVPVTRTSGSYPALDQYLTPTAGAGETAFAGGVKAKPKAEAATLDETEPNFELIQWRLHKVGGYTEVSNELLSDSAAPLEALLSGLFAVSVRSKNERNVLRGSGVSEPLGILNSTAKVDVTPAVNNNFTWADASTMFSRFRSAGGGAVWVIHPSRWPDIFQMEIGTAGANAYVANMAGGQGNMLLGAPILASEHLPQRTNSGAVMLVDLRAYLLFQKGGLSIAFSEHAGFLKDMGTWRFTERTDGQPWLRKPITLADPQGSYQVSPFVNHND